MKKLLKKLKNFIKPKTTFGKLYICGIIYIIFVIISLIFGWQNTTWWNYPMLIGFFGIFFSVAINFILNLKNKK